MQEETKKDRDISDFVSYIVNNFSKSIIFEGYKIYPLEWYGDSEVKDFIQITAKGFDGDYCIFGKTFVEEFTYSNAYTKGSGSLIECLSFCNQNNAENIKPAFKWIEKKIF